MIHYIHPVTGTFVPAERTEDGQLVADPPPPFPCVIWTADSREERQWLLERGLPVQLPSWACR